MERVRMRQGPCGEIKDTDQKFSTQDCGFPESHFGNVWGCMGRNDLWGD